MNIRWNSFEDDGQVIYITFFSRDSVALSSATRREPFQRQGCAGHTVPGRAKGRARVKGKAAGGCAAKHNTSVGSN